MRPSFALGPTRNKAYFLLDHSVEKIKLAVAVSTQLDSATTGVQNLQNQINALNTTFATDAELAQKVVEITDAWAAADQSLNSTLATLMDNKIANFNSTLTPLMASIRTDFASADTALDTALRALIAQNKGSSDTVIAALDTRVETLETNFTSLDTRVETTETDITALQDDVNNLGTNLDTLTNDVTGLTASYNDHITAFENEQEFTNGLGVVQGQHTTEIAALTTQLTNHIASITAALDAAKTDLQTQITALSGRVTVTESLIAALQTKTSTMSDTAKQTQAEVTIETHVDSGKNYVDVPAYVGKPIVFVDRDFMHEGRDYMKDTEVSTRFWFSELQLPDAVCSVVYEAV